MNDIDGLVAEYLDLKERAADRIELIVGLPRHPTEHYARAESVTETIYIMHSVMCRDSGRDLQECPYSVAIDRGIENIYWRYSQDMPVRVTIRHDRLVPAAFWPDESM